ncbi:ion channel [Fulvivirga sedimenti]|uniref:Potassium transporter n=1 Tax=Fulvivirga sedimenti TaxID=2879465 RepID=A0A9X1KW27_9BACT|nr:ion channel [Fulvivirga sedimenti]MCA6073534.1 potassium transporter [Fulvivirga sedimenti]
MAKRFNSSDPGTGTQYTSYSKRIINKDGSFNVKKVALPPSTRNTYQYLIQIGWWKFAGIIVLYLLLMNGFFAFIYLLVGDIHFNGIPASTPLNTYLQLCYFSFQTFTTVGYGGITPIGNLANIVASFEAIFGWMSFAIITGILYGRFSRPSARLKYARHALVSPYGTDGTSLQFRIANMRNSNLMEMEATVMLMIVQKSDKGILKRSFIPLELERNQILFFPLNWTIVHPINQNSPLYGKTRDELIEMEGEILIMIKGFDDTFSQTVHSRYSYKCDEIIWGAKYLPTFDTQPSGDIHLFFDRIHDYEEIPLPSSS